MKLVERRGSFSPQWAAFYVSPLISNPLSKFWFQETVQSSLNCVFSNALAHTLAHMPQAESLQKIKLTLQACQGVCFYFFPKGRREETWFWVTALHMHLVTYTCRRGSPESSTKLCSLCILFSSSSLFQGEKSWSCYLNCTHTTSIYRKKPTLIVFLVVYWISDEY